jgi:hypothetical protein
MNPFELDGVTYDDNFVQELQKELIILRDEALRQAAFKETILLSHVYAVLNNYRKSLCHTSTPSVPQPPN